MGTTLRAGHAAMLDVRGIDTFYGETQVLFGVSLAVAAGEVVALLGPSGAGKTTTLRSILGLTPARRGVIQLGGRDVTRAATHEIARAGVGWVPDDRRVFPSLTALRNLSIARKASPFKAYDTDVCCTIFPALRHLLPRECENMSGGELQMVSISRALVGGAGLILFDEPSQGLAPKIVQDVMHTIVRLREAGVGSLVVDQNVRTVLEVADRVYVMHAGHIVHQGAAEALRDDAAARLALGLAA
jgi:branched-chain amino acid transport system ATP-binding protein